MSPVAAAAGWQARFVAGRKDCRKRPQPKQQNQENANKAPHIEIMLHGNGLRVPGPVPDREKPGLPVKYHRGIALFLTE
jgi:hypothetical protein